MLTGRVKQQYGGLKMAHVKKTEKNSVLTGHCSSSAVIFPQNERKTVISTFTLSFRKYCKDFE